MKEYTYGFEVKHASKLVNRFDVHDLAENKKIFNFQYGGFLKPKTTIKDLDNNALLEIKKKSIFGFSWEISKLEDIEIKKESADSFSKETIKKRVKIVDISKTVGLCSGVFSINTKDGNYLSSNYNSVTRLITDSTGKDVVSISRTSGGIFLTYLVEVDESFDPLIALGVSSVFIYMYIRAQKTAYSC